MDTEQPTVSAAQFVGIFRRRALPIALCVIVATCLGYGYSKHKEKKYTATAALSFNSSQLDQQIAGLSASSVNNALAQQDSDRELVKLGDVAERTAKRLGHGLTASRVGSSLKITAPGESGIVEIAAVSASPVMAAAIANTYAGEFVEEQAGANRRYFESALALVRKQLAALPPAQRFGTDGLDLQERAHTLDLLAELKYGDVQLVQEASVPSSPSSPRTKRTTILAAVFGLLIGLAVAVLLERLDRRLREPEDHEDIYGLPVLGEVRESKALAEVGRSGAHAAVALPPADAEAFSLIRAQLRFLNVGRDVRAVAVVSPAADDGKTTVANQLAQAVARLGSRVLLLEVDLRQPTLARQLGIPPGPGLAGVLLGDISMAEATQSLRVGGPKNGSARDHMFDVLPAGSALPPNPAELLESGAMRQVLADAKSAYELVVIDTPPMTAVSDAFTLLARVDGVLVVARLGRSRRDDSERLSHVLAGSGARLLGLIVNGSQSRAPKPYTSNLRSTSTIDVTTGTASAEELASTIKR